jgi:flagellar basal-body rod modification protein FlgD
MSSIESSNQSLNNILDKIGVRSPEDAPNKRKNSLGQEDFLKLMTTQLQNQDPFAPMENGEFIAQMAQFSTVTGITEMGQTLKGLSDKLNEFRIATASDLLGNSVLVPGNLVRPNKEGEIHGIIDLPSASSETSVSFFDSSGELVHSAELGAHSRGLVGFEWLNIPKEIVEKDEPLRVEAYINTGKGSEGLTPSVFSEVIAASLNAKGQGVTIDVKDFGEMAAADVIKFRN